MANIQNHGFIKRISGRYGQIVVRNRYGRQYLADPPDPSKRVDTPARAAVRERFGEAAAYAKAALANAELAAFYAEVGQADEIGAFAAALRDRLRPPVVTKIGLSRYQRNAGDPITIAATDDAGASGVTGVTVALKAADGTELESGPCTKVMGTWTYVTTTTPPAGQPVTIVATATDHAGNTGEKTEVYP